MVGLYYNNVYIVATEYGNHLGHPVGPKGAPKAIMDGINKFVMYFNVIISLFPKAHVSVKYALFKAYGMSCYVCVLWRFSSKEMKFFYTQWRKCIRRLLNISPMTHCKYLPLLFEDFPIEVQIFKRFIKFINSIAISSNNCMKLCHKLILQGSNSTVCNNLNHISGILACDRNKITVHKDYFYLKLSVYLNNLYTENDFTKTNMIKDVLYTRDLNDTILNIQELNFIINLLCTE